MRATLAAASCSTMTLAFMASCSTLRVACMFLFFVVLQTWGRIASYVCYYADRILEGNCGSGFCLEVQLGGGRPSVIFLHSDRCGDVRVRLLRQRILLVLRSRLLDGTAATRGRLDCVCAENKSGRSSQHRKLRLLDPATLSQRQALVRC